MTSSSQHSNMQCQIHCLQWGCLFKTSMNLPLVCPHCSSWFIAKSVSFFRHTSIHTFTWGLRLSVCLSVTSIVLQSPLCGAVHRWGAQQMPNINSVHAPYPIINLSHVNWAEWSMFTRVKNSEWRILSAMSLTAHMLQVGMQSRSPI